MLLGSISGMVLLAQASDLITVFVGIELPSIPLYVLCATELRRRTSLESGLKYLVIGSVGPADAALRPGPDLRGHRGDAVRRDRPPPRLERPDRRVLTPLLLTGIAPDRHRARLQGARRRRLHQWTPDVYQSAHADHDVHGGGDQGGPRRDRAEAVRRRARAGAARVGPGPGGTRHGGSTAQRGALAQRPPALLARSSVAQAGYPAVVVVGSMSAAAGGDGLLPGRLPDDERGCARWCGARARVRARRRPLLVREPRPDPAVAGVADDDRDAVAGWRAGHGRVHREVLFDRRRRRGRLRLARHRDRAGGRRCLLPARDRGDADGRVRGRAADRAAAHGQAGIRLVMPEADLRAQPRWRRSRSRSRRRRSCSACGRTRCSTRHATGTAISGLR